MKIRWVWQVSIVMPSYQDLKKLNIAAGELHSKNTDAGAFARCKLDANVW